MLSLSMAELGELAFRVLETDGPNAWFVLVVETAADLLSVDLIAELATLGDDAPHAHVARTGAELEALARAEPQGILIVIVRDFASSDWLRTDVNRSRLQRTGATILMVQSSAVEALENLAPNFASWIGGNIWKIEDARPMDPAFVKLRLAALREWAGLEDQEIVRLAEVGKLPPDPEYAEWIALLGRGELLGG